MIQHSEHWPEAEEPASRPISRSKQEYYGIQRLGDVQIQKHPSRIAFISDEEYDLSSIPLRLSVNDGLTRKISKIVLKAEIKSVR